MRLSVQLAGRIVEGDGALFTFAPASARSRERNRALSSGHCRVLGEKEIVMPLVNFIRSHTEEIAEKWEEFAKTLPAARGMAEPALRDHLPRILQAITDDMEKVANAARQSKKDILKRPDEPLERVSDAHARLRLDSGFDLKQVIAEYRGLRASVLGLWNSSATAVTGTEITELIRFNDAVDQLICRGAHPLHRPGDAV
jgi:RsbT co-antagonist protein rsbRD N-terminal domain